MQQHRQREPVGVRRVADHLARVPARRVVVDRHALALPGERAHQRLPADAAVRSHGAQQPCHELRHRRRGAEYSSSASLNIGGFVGQSSMFLSWTGWVMSITLSAQSSFDSLL